MTYKQVSNGNIDFPASNYETNQLNFTTSVTYTPVPVVKKTN